jgi:hypothetical protein
MTKHNLFDLVWAITIAAAVLLLAVDAHAKTIPKQFQGKWCGNGRIAILNDFSNASPAIFHPNTKLAPKDITLKATSAPQSRLGASPRVDGASNSDAPTKQSAIKCGGSTKAV